MSLFTNETEPRSARDSVLRMIIANRRTYREPHTARAVKDVAAYLDDVAVALSEVGVRTSSIEIDARHPLSGRLVVAEYGLPETLVLDWHQGKGWWGAWRTRQDARPAGWRMLTADPGAAAADVAGQLRHDLRTASA